MSTMVIERDALGTIAGPAPAARRQREFQLVTVAGAFALAALVMVTESTFRDLPSEWVVCGTVLVMLAACLCCIRIIRAREGNPWASAAGLGMAYHFYRYGIGALVVYYWEFMPWQAVPAIKMRFYHQGGRLNMETACSLLLLTTLGLFIGCVLPMRRIAAALPDIRWKMDVNRLKVNVLVWIPITVFVLVFLIPRVPDSVQFVVVLLGRLSYLLNVLVSYWMFSARTAAERLKWTFVAFAVCAGSAPVGLMTGQVGEVIAPLVFMAFGYLLARGRLPWLWILGVIPLAFLTAFPYLTLYKRTVELHPDSPVSARIAYTTERFANVDYRAGVEISVERFVARMAASSYTAIFSRFYPDVYPFENGRTFATEMLGLVPRFLWPEKPEVSVELNRYSARVGIVREGGTSSAVFDAISEYYINFGQAGTFFLGLLHGLYLNLLGSWLTLRVAQPLAGALNAAIFFSNPEYFGVGIAFLTHIKLLPVWIIALYFLSRQSRTQAVFRDWRSISCQTRA